VSGRVPDNVPVRLTHLCTRYYILSTSKFFRERMQLEIEFAFPYSLVNSTLFSKMTPATPMRHLQITVRTIAPVTELLCRKS
jgi:hypothetical protein